MEEARIIELFERLDPGQQAALIEFVKTWGALPEDKRVFPMPDTPETYEMVAKLFIGMFGDALKELAES